MKSSKAPPPNAPSKNSTSQPSSPAATKGKNNPPSKGSYHDPKAASFGTGLAGLLQQAGLTSTPSPPPSTSPSSAAETSGPSVDPASQASSRTASPVDPASQASSRTSERKTPSASSSSETSATSASSNAIPSTTLAASLPLQGCKNLLLRRETKGRAGRTVTLLSGVSLPSEVLETWLRNLQKALGCGATVEEDRIVIQGDQIQRLEAWLPSQGATKIRRG